MKIKEGIIVLLVSLAGLQMCGAVQIDGVAAYANAHIITFSDVLSASRELQQMAARRRSGEDINRLYREVLDELINRKLILDTYEDQREIKIPDGMVDERVAVMIREMFKGDRTEFLMTLAEEGQSESAWREQIREQMVVSAMRTLRVENQIRISPLAVFERYEHDPLLFAEPARVRFSMIVIAKGTDESTQAAQREKLATVLSELSEEGDFGVVARRYSEDVMAAEGGLRDWMEVDLLREELRDLVMTTALDTVSEVIVIGPHYSLVKVHGRREVQRVPFEDAYARIERTLRQEMFERIYDEWIVRLRRDSFVRIVNENPF